MKIMNVLSLFDGCSCGQIALQRAGIKVDRYYASEIDKYAMKVTKENFPHTIFLGDVSNVRACDLAVDIDILIGGSPCQGFSFAGKGLNFDDPRSKLFFEYVRILSEIRLTNPKVLFLLENVEMKYEYELVISKYLNVNPITINSSLVSAQNRVRNYWTNINSKPYGLFGDMKPDILQPKDKGILLKDILEKEVPEKYYISEKALARIFKKNYSLPQINPEKTGAISTRNNSGQLAGDSGTTLITNINGKPKLNQDKASCFTAGCHSGGYHSDMDLVITHYGHLDKSAKVSNTGKTPTLKAESHGHEPMVVVHQMLPRSSKNGRGGTGHLSKNDNKSYSLDTNPQTNAIEFKINGEDVMIRRLTEVECERLQTIPDNYTNHVSSTQRYKMLGNGWTVDVVSHILSFCKNNMRAIAGTGT